MATIEDVLVTFRADIRDLDRKVGSIDRSMKSMESNNRRANGALSRMKDIAGGIIAARVFEKVASGLANIARQSISVASRVQEMDIVLENLSKQNGRRVAEIQGYVEAIKNLGITTAVAQSTVSQGLRMGLDLDSLPKLARASQDFAVLSGKDSSDTLQRILYGVVTRQSEVLRTAGVQVTPENAMKKYAEELGKTVKALTETEKTQAIVNAVLEQATTITGTYEASLESAGKRQRSLNRHVQETYLAVGEQLLPAYGKWVDLQEILIKGLRKATEEGGALYPIIGRMGDAAERMIDFFIDLTRNADLSTFGENILDLVESFMSLYEAAEPALQLLTMVGIQGAITILNPLIEALTALMQVLADAPPVLNTVILLLTGAKFANAISNLSMLAGGGGFGFGQLLALSAVAAPFLGGASSSSQAVSVFDRHSDDANAAGAAAAKANPLYEIRKLTQDNIRFALTTQGVFNPGLGQQIGPEASGLFRNDDNRIAQRREFIENQLGQNLGFQEQLIANGIPLDKFIDQFANVGANGTGYNFDTGLRLAVGGKSLRFGDDDSGVITTGEGGQSFKLEGDGTASFINQMIEFEKGQQARGNIDRLKLEQEMRDNAVFGPAVGDDLAEGGNQLSRYTKDAMFHAQRMADYITAAGADWKKDLLEATAAVAGSIGATGSVAPGLFELENPTAGGISKLFGGTIGEFTSFTDNIKTALSMGLNAKTVSEIIMAGPEAAGTLLGAVVKDSTGTMVEALNMGERELAKFQLQQMALAENLALALSVEGLGLEEAFLAAQAKQELISSNWGLTAEELAERLGVPQSKLDDLSVFFDEELFPSWLKLVADIDANPLVFSYSWFGKGSLPPAPGPRDVPYEDFEPNFPVGGPQSTGDQFVFNGVDPNIVYGDIVSPRNGN
jgi:hypothetical protein